MCEVLCGHWIAASKVGAFGSESDVHVDLILHDLFGIDEECVITTRCFVAKVWASQGSVCVVAIVGTLLLFQALVLWC